MRLRLRELNELHADPESWIETRLQNEGGPTLLGGYGMLAREGIFHFHKHPELPQHQHEEYIRWRLGRRGLSNPSRSDWAIDSFRRYVRWFRDSSTVVGLHRVNLNVQLVSGIILGEQVSRIDLTTSGHRAVNISSSENVPSDWDTQFSTVIMQRGIAHTIGRDEGGIEVGVQSLAGDQLATAHYSTATLDSYWDRILELANLVAQHPELV